MVKVTEGTFKTDDGFELFEKAWEPDSPATAHLIFLHGFSDHISAYYDLFPTLASPAYSIHVHGIDQRGWGRSVHETAQRGLTGPTSKVISDIHEYAVHVSAQAGSAPLFLMGHSMGGAEALVYLLTSSSSLPSTRPTFSGLLLESPYIALDPSSQPNGFTVFAGKLAAKVMPNMPLKQKLDATYMSRDPKVRSDWVQDPLCHDTGTLEGLAGMLQRAADLVLLSLSPTHPPDGLVANLPCPVFWTHGSDDRVCSFVASKKLCDVVLMADGAQKDFHDYPGAYHKLHAEPDGVGAGFARDVGAWIVARAKAGGDLDGAVKSKL